MIKRCSSTALKGGRIAIIVLLLLLAIPAANAQQHTITLPGGQTTVGKIMREIYEQAGITFAFDSRTFDTSRTVKTDTGRYGLQEALGLIIADTDFSYLMDDDYVVINSSPKAKALPARTLPRTNDRYVIVTPGQVDALWDERRAEEPVREPDPDPEPVTVREYPAPYSDYRSPNLYARMQDKLPRLAVKANLLYGAALLTPNLSGELGLSPRMSVEFGGAWNRFNRVGTPGDNMPKRERTRLGVSARLFLWAI